MVEWTVISLLQPPHALEGEYSHCLHYSIMAIDGSTNYINSYNKGMW